MIAWDDISTPTQPTETTMSSRVHTANSISGIHTALPDKYNDSSGEPNSFHMLCSLPFASSPYVLPGHGQNTSNITYRKSVTFVNIHLLIWQRLLSKMTYNWAE